MRSSSLTAIYDQWTEPSYEIRVRGTAAKPTYLWGSAKISDRTFDKPLLLHIRNHVFGAFITFGTEASGTQTTIGSLEPGECVSIQVQTMSGVFAWCHSESVVACLIRESR